MFLFTYKILRKEILPQWSERCRETFQMDCTKISFLHKKDFEPWHWSQFLAIQCLFRASSMEKIHTFRHQKAYSRAHVAVLFMCLESEWESLGWIATHPNPLSNNVRCGGKINLFSVSCFLAIVITLRLSYIGAWALKPSPAWRNTKKWFHKFLFSLFLKSCFFSFLKLHKSITVHLPRASNNTQWYLLRYISKGAGNNTVV